MKFDLLLSDLDANARPGSRGRRGDRCFADRRLDGRWRGGRCFADRRLDGRWRGGRWRGGRCFGGGRRGRRGLERI